LKILEKRLEVFLGKNSTYSKRINLQGFEKYNLDS